MKHSNVCTSTDFYPKMSKVTMGKIQRDGHYKEARRFQCRQDMDQSILHRTWKTDIGMQKPDRRNLKHPDTVRFSKQALYRQAKPAALDRKSDKVYTNAKYFLEA